MRNTINHTIIWNVNLNGLLFLFIPWCVVDGNIRLTGWIAHGIRWENPVCEQEFFLDGNWMMMEVRMDIFICKSQICQQKWYLLHFGRKLGTPRKLLEVLLQSLLKITILPSLTHWPLFFSLHTVSLSSYKQYILYLQNILYTCQVLFKDALPSFVGLDMMRQPLFS